MDQLMFPWYTYALFAYLAAGAYIGWIVYSRPPRGKHTPLLTRLLAAGLSFLFWLPLVLVFLFWVDSDGLYTKAEDQGEVIEVCVRLREDGVTREYIVQIQRDWFRPVDM